MSARAVSLDGASRRQWEIGLDVGGTKIAGGLVDSSSGTVLERRQVPTRAERGGEAILRDVVALAEELTAEAVARDEWVRRIGIGVAELVDSSGRIQSAQTIDWTDLSPGDALAHLAPVVIESDVRAAALAEAHLGAGRPYPIFAYITVGTGISSCLVLDGRPYAGSRGSALVLASAPLSSTCRECGTRQDDILEQIASGPALVARYNARTHQGVRIGRDVVDAAAQGDADAEDVLRTAGDALGNSVGWLVNVLDPDAVVVGGGLGLAGGLYWQAFLASTRAHVWSEATRDLPIITASLGTDSGIIGAAMAASGVSSVTDDPPLRGHVTSQEG